MKKLILLLTIFVLPAHAMEQISKHDGAVYLLAKSKQVDLKTEAIQQYFMPQVEQAQTLRDLEVVCARFMPLYVDCLSLRKHRNLYALDQAITHKEQEIALYIFRRMKGHGIKFDLTKGINDQNIPVLMSAAMIDESYDNSLLKLLLMNGANPNITSYIFKDTPLHAAVRHFRLGNVRALLQAGADINAQNCQGQTPLYKAVCSSVGRIKMVELLIESGADINMKTSDGVTPLMQAIIEGYENIAQLLINKGADVNAQDADGWTALHEAAFSRSKERAQILINAGAHINTQTDDGWSVLHFAARFGSLKLTQLFLKYKADKLIKNEEGQTPQDIARAYGYPIIAALLAA